MLELNEDFSNNNFSSDVNDSKEDLKIINENMRSKKLSAPLQNTTINNYINLGKNQENKPKNSVQIITNKDESKMLAENVLKMINSSNHKKPKYYKKINNGSDSKNIYENKNIINIEHMHLNIYEREKRNIKRKNNLIQKKIELKIQDQIANLKNPEPNEFSKNILSQNGDYIPIQERASNIYNMHQLYNILNEAKKRMKKIEKEKEEVLLIQKYRNEKPFNQNEWNDFVQNQEYWYKQKQLKQKAIELMKGSVELKISHKPKIDNNSKKIVNNNRKRNNYEDDIYNKLYNDFNDIQEKKQLKISNSMPSFKPILNKGIKKSVFKPNKIMENNHKKNIEKQIELLIQNKLKELKHPKNYRSHYTNKTFVNPNFIHDLIFNSNSKSMKNIHNKNKRYNSSNSYDNKSIKSKYKKRTQNLSNGSLLLNLYNKNLYNKQKKKI